MDVNQCNLKCTLCILKVPTFKLSVTLSNVDRFYKIVHVTVLLPVYFCDQFVGLEICHSRRLCSVCQNQHGIQ